MASIGRLLRVPVITFAARPRAGRLVVSLAEPVTEARDRCGRALTEPCQIERDDCGKAAMRLRRLWLTKPRPLPPLPIALYNGPGLEIEGSAARSTFPLEMRSPKHSVPEFFIALERRGQI